MKLIIENWRKLLLTEAAKSAQDLKDFYDNNWQEHNNMIRGLWKKYGMWKLGDMMNIGIPQRVKDDWGSYDKKRKDYYTKAYWEAMLRKKPPIPIIVATHTPARGSSSGAEIEVSYGAIFPKMAEPAILLKFDAGISKKSGNLMQKSRPIENMPGGSVNFYPAPRNYGECNDVFIVSNTFQTTDGWGPLLYDVAMEIATVLGGGLTSSRTMVSSKAKPVWDFYQDRRSDVKKDQLDVKGDEAKAYGVDQLTPNDKSDDCTQQASFKWAHGEDYGAWEKFNVKNVFSKMQGMSDEEKANVPWADQSISKGYQKDPDILKFLGDQGLLHFPQLGYDAIKFHTSELPPPPMDNEMEKARSKFRSQTTLSERKIRIKIK